MRLSDDVEDSKIMPNKMPKCPDIGPRRLTNDELVVWWERVIYYIQLSVMIQ